MSDTSYCTGCGYHAANLANRIEELDAEIADLKTKLAKAAEALNVLSDYENLDTSGGYYDGGCAIFSYQARRRYGDFDDLARATLAELTGGNDE